MLTAIPELLQTLTVELSGGRLWNAFLWTQRLIRSEIPADKVRKSYTKKKNINMGGKNHTTLKNTMESNICLVFHLFEGWRAAFGCCLLLLKQLSLSGHIFHQENGLVNQGGWFNRLPFLTITKKESILKWNITFRYILITEGVRQWAFLNSVSDTQLYLQQPTNISSSNSHTRHYFQEYKTRHRAAYIFTLSIFKIDSSDVFTFSELREYEHLVLQMLVSTVSIQNDH